MKQTWRRAAMVENAVRKFGFLEDFCGEFWGLNCHFSPISSRFRDVLSEFCEASPIFIFVWSEQTIVWWEQIIVWRGEIIVWLEQTIAGQGAIFLYEDYARRKTSGGELLHWLERKNGPLGRRCVNRLRCADGAASTPMPMRKAAIAPESAAGQLLMNNVRGYKKRKRSGRSVLFLCALQDGLEPTTPWLTVRCSNQLSYWSSFYQFGCKSNRYFPN